MNTYDTLQHFRNETNLQPLFHSLDDLSKRVGNADIRTKNLAWKPHERGGTESHYHAPQLEEQELPSEGVCVCVRLESRFINTVRAALITRCVELIPPVKGEVRGFA